VSKTRVTVVGATGYAGAELVRLLENHPLAEVVAVTSSRLAGRPLDEACPWLSTGLVLQELNLDQVEGQIVFLCQETGFAMGCARQLTSRARVIDLSADFRLKDQDAYETFYKRVHSDPTLPAVYGLPELVDRNAIASAQLVANPGCHPTAALLALMPLIKAGIAKGVPIVDSKSGVSGAGRSRTEVGYLFAEADNNFKAYGVAMHRHTPEIEQMAGVHVRLTPHLVPMPRGIHATLYVEMSEPTDLIDLYEKFYRGERFVKIQQNEPSTKQVLGTNVCAIAPFYDPRTGLAVVCSVIDNLVKGAAGQAIQNMNLMIGAPENCGLPESGLWP
jgi:N-acetyl-gamma-glutamyl-phosphate reductase